ncbi:MAG: SDR family oxidoreductase [Betaproteobacteria bacterium]|jgi:nucleoside-diphosphate-sugar epimerase|nr:SDR family oxidoreductase [Betaproteobacteria bacterium]
MKVFITGGGGFLGYRLARTLLERGTLTGRDGKAAPITQIKLLDTVFPPQTDPRLQRVQGDLSAPGTIAAALEPDTASVFHLASVVSAGAEADFDLGMRVNLEGTRILLEACRQLERPPRLVFTSSVAAFGGELPATLDDSTTPKPQTSYGTQKVIGEYLVADYTRRGFLDGRSLRLPTIVVRPGKPNLAASSFASAIFREPLGGEIYECPLPDTTGIWLLSPRKVIEAFVHAHDLPETAWGSNRVVNLPGITITIRQAVAELRRIAGREVAERVRFKIDPRIKAIVDTWPVRFATPRALAMGFSADSDIESVIRDHIREQGIAV